MNKRFLIIGIDGLNKYFLKYIRETVKAPNFINLCNNFFFNDILSILPTGSLAAWLSILSGQNPTRHGILGFKTYQPGSYYRPLTDLNFLDLKTIVDYLEKAGMISCTVNVPGTYPNKELEKNISISGILSPGIDESVFYPKKLYSEIKDIVGEYRIFPRTIDFSNPDQYIKTLDSIKEIIEINHQTLKYCVENYQPVYTIINFFVIDTLQHYFWPFFEPEKYNPDQQLYEKVSPKLKEVVLKLDEILGFYIDYAERNKYNLIVMSDHGMAGIDSIFCINKFLEQNNYLKIKSSRKRLRRFLKFLRPLYRIYKNIVSIDSIKQKAEELDLGDKLFMDSIDWTHTKACMDIDYFQGLFINKKGREPEGIVESNYEYELLRDELIGKLKDVKSLNGQPIFEDVLKREDYYPGQNQEFFPDLLFKYTDGCTVSRKIIGDSLFDKKDKLNACHGSKGVFFAKGPDIGLGINDNNKYKDMCVLDIMPSILNALDLEIPEDIDGIIRKELFL